MNHSWDRYTEFCIKCGAGRIQIERGDRPVECVADENVTGISHHIAYRRLSPIVDDVMGRIK